MNSFLSWIKEIGRTVRRGQGALKNASLKHDISRLERERAREKTAMLRQRRFYERLLRRPEKTPSEPFMQKEPHIEAVREAKAVEEKTPEAIVGEAPKKPAVSLFRRLQLAMRARFSKGTLAAKLAEERKQEEAAQTKNEVEARSWQPYNSVKANLVKDQGVLFFNWRQRILMLSLALVLCSLAIGLVYVGLLIWQKERLNDSQSTLANFEAINIEVSKNEKEIEDIIAFNRKLDIANFIVNNHIHWTNYLAFLENNTLKDVYYHNFSGDLSGNYTIGAVAKNLDAISLQLEVMKASNLTRSVQYSDANTVKAGPDQPETVNFNLEMSVDPKIFLK